MNLLEELKLLEEKGYVRSSRHNTLPLTVWNYTPPVQYEQLWGEYPLLRKCRGIVTDREGIIVSHPFQKFHNWEELSPSERPCTGDRIEITLKMDGSLIIVSRYNNELVFNSRGSFNSDQAIQAEKLFYSMYDSDWIEDGFTYCFEYVAPENRIVVQYTKPDLIHLAKFETSIGRDLERDFRFHCVESYSLNGGIFGEELYDLFLTLDMQNKEGFVIRQVIDEPRQNFRMKWKTESYKELHRIVTGISSTSVYEMLRDEKSFDEIISVIPDELYNWLTATKNNLVHAYSEVAKRAKLAYDQVKDLPSRKEQAIAIMKNHSDVSGIVFQMLDGKSPNESIWKMIKPKYECPFKNKGEE